MSTLQGSTRVDLRMRLISAAAGIPVLVVVVWLGGYVMAAVTALASLLALNEALGLVDRAGWSPSRWVGVAWGLGLVIAAAVGGGWVVWAISAGAAAAAAIVILQRRSLACVGSFTTTAIPTLYVGLSLATLVLLRNGLGGLQWVALAFAATFATDTGAYFVGRSFGKRKLAPSISPGKTWEGSVGGFVAAIAATVVLALLLPDVTMNMVETLALGAAIGSLSQLGDLLESKLKRLAGVKDSGVFLPGHGGILDRLDSLLIVFPLVYLASLVA